MIYFLETEITCLANLIVTFWNCCFALFKSSLRCPEQSRYLRTCKIHGAKRGSHDRRLHRLRGGYMLVSAYRGYRGPRRKFRPQQPRLLSLFLFLILSFLLHLLLFLSPFCRSSTSFSLLFPETRRTRVAISRPRKDPQLPPGTCYEGKLFEGRTRRQLYIPTVHTGRIPDVNTYNRRKVQTSVAWPSIRSLLSRTAVLNHPSREVYHTEEVPCIFVQRKRFFPLEILREFERRKVEE